jgi:plasmid maintenance system antidote protein VapI
MNDHNDDPYDPDAPFDPDWVVPPGDMLLEVIECRGWNRNDAREIIGWHPDFLDRVIASDIGIDPKLADDLAQAFGNNADYWLNLQRFYDEWLTKQS